MESAAFKFLSPLWLLLLPPLWWMAWSFARRYRRRSMWSKLCDPPLLDHMRPRGGTARNRNWRIWPMTIVLSLATLAAAGPSWRQQAHPLLESANARIVALELSRAMLVEDVLPNRFAQAIAAAREIVKTDFEGETGLVVFSGAAFVLAPLSKDVNTLLAFIDVLEPGMLPLQGTRIDLAIELAQDLLKASISGRGQIVIITSGSERNSKAVQAASNAVGRGHRVSVMAIGTQAGGPLLGDKGALIRDEQGGYVLARTHFGDLLQIANAGQGVLVTLTRPGLYRGMLESRIKAASLVEAEQPVADEQRFAANEGIWLVWLALPFALLLFRRNLLWVILAALLLPGQEGVYAAQPDTFWQHRERRAFDAFRRGDLQLCIDLSSDPMLKGSAYYRKGQYAEALELFRQIETPRSFYNRGNSLAMQQQFPAAIDAYAHALELEPGFGEARYNKRLLELYLEQRQNDADQSGESTAQDDALESLDENGADSRAGVVGQDLNNPGDEPQAGSGLGASAQIGQVDPVEQFDGGEQQQERFSLSDDIDQARAQMLVERWVKTLPTTSSELFRRKFERDYQRQMRQSR
ncbi:MAG: VWA domain-containing protein [Gammaproteobacteria bacterium]|nr:VWA domain-containing protein [Gammaproteobacteria bacterium]